MNLRRTPRTKKPCRLSPENAAAVALIVIAFVMLFNLFVRCSKGAEVGPYEASVLVQAGNGGPESFSGSGTAIDKNYVITCYHVVRGQTQYRVWDKKEWMRAELVAYYSDPDIAVLKVEKELDYAPLGEEIDESGKLTGYGFAGSQTLYKTDGELDQHLQFQNGDLSCTIDWRSGDSGGGIFIGDKFVGVGWGSSREYTGVSNCVFAPIRRIRSALRNWCETGRLRPSRPYFGIQIDNTQQCQPGMECYPGNNQGSGSNRVPANQQPNNPYNPNPIPDDERPPVVNKPNPPVTPPAIPNKEICEIKEEIAKINDKIDGISQKQDEIVGKLVDICKPVESPATPVIPEITPENPPINPPAIASGTLPNGKFRIKVQPKGK